MGERRNELCFRPGRREDHAEIEEMTREVWGGDDYLASVWDEWVQEPNRRLRVATVDGRIVATASVVEYLPGNWWLEGVRVHPAWQGQGYASRIHHHLVALVCQQPGVHTLGLFTNARNQQVTHLARSSGMTAQGTYRYFKGSTSREQVEGVSQVGAAEGRALLASLHQGNWLSTSGGYLMEGWVARRPDQDWLDQLLAAGQVWRCGDAVALLDPAPTASSSWLYLVEGGSEQARTTLIRFARQQGFPYRSEHYLRCLVPADEKLFPPFLAAGMHDPHDSPLYLSHYMLRINSPAQAH